MSEMVSIYALAEGPSDPPRYVGKTMNWLNHRYRAHLSEARRGKNRPVNRWIRKLLQSGKEPALIWLENVKPNQDWQERESHWISKFREEGADLLNLTDGGEGIPGARKSRLARAKIAIRNRTGEYIGCPACGSRFWVKKSHTSIRKFCSRACKNSQQTAPEAFLKAGSAATVSARKAMTHCKRGHPYADAYVYSRGRLCKQCHNMRKHSYREKRRAKHKGQP